MVVVSTSMGRLVGCGYQVHCGSVGVFMAIEARQRGAQMMLSPMLVGYQVHALITTPVCEVLCKSSFFKVLNVC